MEAAPPPDVARYAEQVVLVSRRALGPNLVAAYLYGSAVLGGFTPARSDVDILLVVAGGRSCGSLRPAGLSWAGGGPRAPPPPGPSSSPPCPSGRRGRGSAPRRSSSC